LKAWDKTVRGYGYSKLTSATHFQNKISAVKSEYFTAAEVHEVLVGKNDGGFRHHLCIHNQDQNLMMGRDGS
jgi:hypothetical protein